jgi:hypothetical protein
VRFDANGDVRPRRFTVARLTPQTGSVPGVQNVADVEAILSP